MIIIMDYVRKDMNMLGQLCFFDEPFSFDMMSCNVNGWLNWLTLTNVERNN